MSEALRQFVRERAGGRCKYCRLPEARPPIEPFHLEHIVARQHGGQSFGGTEGERWPKPQGCNWNEHLAATVGNFRIHVMRGVKRTIAELLSGNFCRNMKIGVKTERDAQTKLVCAWRCG